MYNYWNYIQKIAFYLEQGKGYLAELHIRKLLCRILYYVDKKYTVYTIKEKLYQSHCETYKTAVFQIFESKEYSKEVIDDHIRKLIDKLITSSKDNKPIFEVIPKYFFEEIHSKSKDTSQYNSLRVYSKGITLQFDTVHGVKGETHDATLYLETEKSGVSDIKSVIPYFDKGKILKSSEYNRKCVYVGMSRPRKLLCLAISKKTYDNSGKTFESWDVVHCHNS